MKLLDTKDLQVGIRVITLDGKRTGTVRGINTAFNTIGILFDGEKTATLECNPSQFKILTIKGLRLIGQAPKHTIPRSSL